jgi:hypothetical protein
MSEIENATIASAMAIVSENAAIALSFQFFQIARIRVALRAEVQP